VSAMPLPVDELRSELQSAIEAKKCWRCGCFQDAVVQFDSSHKVQSLLGPMLMEARSLFQDKRYNCLGCDVCWPVVAINAAAEIDPAVAEADHCLTQRSRSFVRVGHLYRVITVCFATRRLWRFAP
jgi:tetrahydromethanopterin S-methyltransferase subunit A